MWVRFLPGAPIKLFLVFDRFIYNPLQRGYGLVVEHVLAKDEMGVRFSLTAQQGVSGNAGGSLMHLGRTTQMCRNRHD